MGVQVVLSLLITSLDESLDELENIRPPVLN